MFHYLSSVAVATALSAAAFFGIHGNHDNASSTDRFPTTTERGGNFDHGFDRGIGSTTPRFDHNNATSTANAIVCVGGAVSIREQSLDTAMAAYTSALNSAYTARASALLTAYVPTTPDAVRTAVKTAWGNFASTTQSARQAWRTAQTNAWTTFRTAARACKAPESLIDSERQTIDLGFGN